MPNPIALSLTARGRPISTFVFDQDEITLGRSASNHVVFDPALDSGVSRHHAVLRRIEDGTAWSVEDLGSTQGTLLNGKPCYGVTLLKPHDVLTFGAEGPRLSLVWERTRDDDTETKTIVSQWRGTVFPLALFEDFPRRFQVYQRIGEGGYGQVWRARSHADPDSWLAIKVIRPELLTGDSDSSMQRIQRVVERFRREVALMRAVEKEDARHFVRVHEWNANPRLGFLWMSMDYIRGASLDRLITRDPLMPAGRVCHLMAQAAESLDRLHHAQWFDAERNKQCEGIVHRDIKPSNLLVREADDHLFVCDFGIAGIQRGSARITQFAQRVVTHRYSAPEVLASNTITPMTDLWGLAVTTFVMLTGGLYPYDGVDHSDVLDSIVKGRMRRLDSARTDLDPRLVELVHSGLDYDMLKRPASAAEWRDRLKALALAPAGR